ncbi:putative amidohydrolase [Desulfitobacterium dichloroeliminans LMG P-21439]|uniref:Putative amidohydrolase n=1 Tax=Desulfitobacterium dichloroeliminans (strain LMG P-21439 / DCA1) TaxID=871963 RepID=L0F4D1_DESDL|nr:nitrilase-related carbon-nitrogen hydrolase [Desulfitobacterium dichloroeliminans]AGA67803.1 putative amidohydrolase [Desulfitobacterium dichloroeliminans LMG P-21439]
MLEDKRIGLVQMEARVGETRSNLNTIIRCAEKASQQGIELLCFPESALHGYSPADSSEIGDSLDSPRLKELKECARDYNLILLVGMVEQIGKGQNPYLSHLVLFPDQEKAVYRKVHLGRSEQNYFTPGSQFPVFKGKGVCFAVGICWDWHFPEMATIYSLKGAELLFAPHASPVVAGDRKEIWKRYLGTRAYDNSTYLGACNLIGPNNRGKVFSGGALAFGPKGEILAESFHTPEDDYSEEILIADLSAPKINALRSAERVSMKQTFFLADRRKELYGELLELEIPKAPKE